MSNRARTDEVKACLKISTLWPHVNKFKLSKSIRLHLGGKKSAGRFLDHLFKISNGDYPTFDEMITISENVCTF